MPPAAGTSASPDRTGNPAAPASPAGGRGGSSASAGGSGAGSGRLLIWLVVVLALAVVGLLTALLMSGGQTSGAPEGTVSTSSASSSTQPGAAAVEVVAEDLIGQDVDDVVADLTARGLNVEQVAQAGSAPEGEVLAVSPAGTLSPGDTVTVTHSSGPEMVTLPDDLTGRPAGEVTGEITGLGVNVDVYYEETDAQDDGDVVRVQPGGGEEVEVGSSVDLYVAGSADGAGPSPTTSEAAQPSAAAPAPSSPEPGGPETETEQTAETAAGAAPAADAAESLPAEG